MELFSGCGTALVTPFRGGKLDLAALEGLLDIQIAAGVDAVIVLGTTGEPAALSVEERRDVIQTAAAACRGGGS